MKAAKFSFFALVLFTGTISKGESTTTPDPQALFAGANQDYGAGRFREAINGYEQLIRNGVRSANLLYDAGNAWFRLGDFGNAVLNYERALALEPRHPEAIANLQRVRDESRALELKRNWVSRYAEIATVKEFAVAASIAFWVAAFLSARLLFTRTRSPARVFLLSMAILIFALSVIAVFARENGEHGKSLAIVTQKNIVARLATADSANAVLALPPGSEIKIVSYRGDWIYAALPNDLRGWIAAKGAERVRL